MKTESSVSVANVIRQLRLLADPGIAAGLARFGIQDKKALGISIPALRALGRKLGKNHRLAGNLWKSEIHEARILACYLEEPECVTPAQMEKWVMDFDSWDVCDQVCGNCFVRTPWAEEKAMAWAGRNEEFVKRAGFVLMAYLSVHDKKADDSMFLRFLPVIEREAGDERNFVRKAVNWALRQIGKRNSALKKSAIETAGLILKQETKASLWVARDALRELESRKSKIRL